MPQQLVLVFNAGSSSLKYQVVDPATGTAVVRGLVERVDETGLGHAREVVTEAVTAAGIRATDLLGVGHRVVHGGTTYTSPTLVDDSVVAGIDELSRLAPLHNPPAVRTLEGARAAYPDLPHVAVFDTAFFADLPAAAATYALDTDVSRREGIRRYGMHGTSHEYVAAEAAQFLGREVSELDQIVLHLGNGASAAAVHGGRPVDTSMGFTPLEGLVMGTRPGDLDAGVVPHLMRHGYDDAAIEDLLFHRSGLQGLAGVHDFRDLRAAVDAGDEGARTAYDVYCHRIRKYVGAYLAVLGGADTVVFTAGVGEHVPRVREDALAGLERLGIAVDPALNRAPIDGQRLISSADSRVAVLVVPTDEELAIARKVATLVSDG